MFVIYHDQVLKVIDFHTMENGERWLDLGLGFYVSPDSVDILINRDQLS